MTAQLSVAAVAVVAVIGMVMLNPYWLLGFSFVQGLLFLGLAFYVTVVDWALASNKTTCVRCDGRPSSVRRRTSSVSDPR